MKSIQSRPDARFVACAAGVASAALLGTSRQADAAIVWSGVVNIAIPSNADGVFLNVITGQSGATGNGVAGWDIRAGSATGLSFLGPTASTYVTGLGSSTLLIDNLAQGSLIGAAATFGAGSVETEGSTAFFPGSMSNLVGFRFVNESTGLTHYGWMRVLLGGNGLGDQPRSIIEYAYENVAGIGIGAGQIVPAPGAIALLAIAGAAGRRRR